MYCGRCKDSFTPDSTWAETYLEREATRLRRQVDHGYVSEARARELLEETLAYFRSAGLSASPPEF